VQGRRFCVLAQKQAARALTMTLKSGAQQEKKLSTRHVLTVKATAPQKKKASSEGKKPLSGPHYRLVGILGGHNCLSAACWDLGSHREYSPARNTGSFSHFSSSSALLPTRAS